jgi:hypothetical protein
MADVATPSAAAVATAGATAGKTKPQFVKPEKPDDEAFKTAEAKAKQEHVTAQEKFVGALHLYPLQATSPICTLDCRWWDPSCYNPQFLICLRY